MSRPSGSKTAAPPTIHVIGDSHTSIFTGLHGVCGKVGEFCTHALPGFRVWHLGEFLAHSVGSKKHAVHAKVKHCVAHAKPSDPIAFVFGEIDCRNHVVKHAPTDDAIESVARDVARRYVEQVRVLVPNRRIAFVALPPATVAAHSNTNYPSVGTFAQRARAVRAFNRSLHEHASQMKSAVIDVHDHLATPTGEPNPAYFADGVHADPRALPLFLGECVRLKWLRATSPAVAAGQALSHVQPPHASGVFLPGRLDDERAARRILIERAALVCKAHGAKQIAIWGAGNHTRSMGLDVFRSVGLRVAAILDDHPPENESLLHGVPVRRPADTPRGIDAVVISSDAHEAAILTRAREHFKHKKTLIVPIYAWQECSPLS